MKPKLTTLLLAIASVTSLAGCAYEQVTYRFRLSVEIFCGGKSHIGSSVYEVSSGKRPSLQGGSMSYRVVSGDAVAVDLGSCGKVFILLRGPQPGDEGLYRNTTDTLLSAAFKDKIVDIGKSDPSLPIDRLIPKLTGKGDLKPSSLPMIVAFKDINDPKTMRKIDPSNMVSLGKDAYLERSYLEITTEPPTRGLERTLIWLPTADWLRLYQDTFPPVTPSDFVDRQYFYKHIIMR